MTYNTEGSQVVVTYDARCLLLLTQGRPFSGQQLKQCAHLCYGVITGYLAIIMHQQYC